jgi:hypothetical protein
MKVDPAASLRGQHTEQNTITEYMIFEFTAYTATDGVFVSGTLEWWSIGCCLVVILLTWKQLRRDPTRIKSGLCGDGFGGISNNKPTPPSDR